MALSMWFKKITYFNYFLVASTLSIIVAIGILAVRNYLPPVIPLFYGKPVGPEELASKDFLFIVPVISAAISIVNIIISKSESNDFIKKILAATSLVVSFMAAVTVTKIILLVGFFNI